jgi:circadian clock protein KaiC
MESINFGIKGFEKLFDGKRGIRKGSNVLIYGKAGCGKTIFSLEFIYKGAVEFNEPGVYVSLEGKKDNIISQCEQFGWNIKKLIKEKKISFVSMNLTDINRDFATTIYEEAKKIKAKRIVIDSLSLLTLSPIFIKDSGQFSLLHKDKIYPGKNPSQFIYNLINILNDCGTTNLYLTVPGEKEEVTKDGVSEYVCDGIIHLKTTSLGKSFLRLMEITKMRSASVRGGIYGFEINDEGLVIE